MDTYIPFSIPDTHIGLLSICGQLDEDLLVVERRACASGCDDGCWLPFSPAGCQLEVTNKIIPLQIDIPGQFRLVWVSDPHTGVRVCLDTYPVRTPISKSS